MRPSHLAPARRLSQWQNQLRCLRWFAGACSLILCASSAFAQTWAERLGYPPTAKMGFVLVTGKSDATLIERGRKFHMNNYLEKPIDAPKMKKCIEDIVGSLD